MLSSPQINPAASLAKGMVVNALVKRSDLADGLIELKLFFKDSFTVFKNSTSNYMKFFLQIINNYEKKKNLNPNVRDS
jgi:hypothetical protein